MNHNDGVALETHQEEHKEGFGQKLKRKVASRNWTYILRVGSFLSGGGLVTAGVFACFSVNPLNIIVGVYLVALGLVLLGALIPWPKTWRKLTRKYVPFLHTYRGRGVYLIFLGTLAAGTETIVGIIAGIVITFIGLLHCILAFFFRDVLDKAKEEPDDGKPADMNTLKQEVRQAAVQTAWDNRDTIARTAYDNREFIADNAANAAQYT